jgi:four helix bundle protein
MNYEEWTGEVPEEITGDSLWKMETYRLGLFVADVGWHDVTKLLRDRRTLGLSDQLYKALGSISANLAEGYSRGTGRDRAHFYEYSLGSARESRDWYYKGRHVLGEAITQHRLRLLTQIIRLLLTMIPQQRGHILKEEEPTYHTGYDALLTNVPMPFET